jgi:prolyl oligopeptidase
MQIKLILIFSFISFSLHAQNFKGVEEEICGQKVYDPFRQFEDLEDSLVQNWMKEQAVDARQQLDQFTSRKKFTQLLTDFDQEQKATVEDLKITASNRYFYLKRKAGENSLKLYYRQGRNGTEILLFDPEAYEDGSSQINYHQPDPKGEKVIFCLTKAGAEIGKMLIIDVASEKLLDHQISNAWPSDGGGVSWTKKGQSFIYLHHPISDPKAEGFLTNMQAFHYQLKDQSIDTIFSYKYNPEINLQDFDFPIVSLQGKYLFGEVLGGEPYGDAYYAKAKQLKKKKVKWQPLFKKTDKIAKYLVDGDDLYFTTANRFDQYELCKTSLKNPDFQYPQVLLPANENQTITDFELTKDGLYIVRQENGVKASLSFIDRKEENFKKIDLPETAGTIYLEKKSIKDSELWITIVGWLTNFKRYQYHFEDEKWQVDQFAPTADFECLKDFEVKEVLVKSHDGVEVPLSMIHQKGIKLDGQNRVLFFGYGAYGFSATPFFFEPFLTWVRAGGILAVPHVRGGGEKGAAWHEAGLKQTKANSWKDLIACVEYCINEGYSSNKKTAVWALSAGGIMLGRAITERPELFAAAIPEVATLNPSRAEYGPNGANGTKEFGSIFNKEECGALLEMDAYLHVKKGVNYPATLVMTGANDPRVPVWQSTKFAAALMQAQKADQPILLNINYDAGHAQDQSRATEMRRIADILSFAWEWTE